jgi:hypothetical protein
MLAQLAPHTGMLGLEARKHQAYVSSNALPCVLVQLESLHEIQFCGMLE